MRIFSLLLAMTLLLAPSFSQSPWSSPVPIAASTSNDLHPAIANGEQWLFGGGEEMMAFSRNGKNIGILRTTGGGAAWSDNATFITTDSADNDFPSLIHTGAQSNERAMLVWQSRKNGNLDIYFSKYDQAVWSEPQPIAMLPGDDMFPHIAQTEGYCVTWENHGTILFSEYDGTSWSSPVMVSEVGDSLNHVPRLGRIYYSSALRPVIVWERVKYPDTARAVICSYRLGATWSAPDTLVHFGDNRNPRFFKYEFGTTVQWEKIVEGTHLAYSGDGNIVTNKLRLSSVSPLTFFPDFQRNVSVNGFMIIVLTNPPPSGWYAVSTWESQGSSVDSIGAAIGPFVSTSQKLGAAGALANRNPDVSQGTTIISSSYSVRFWVVWEANVSGRWQLFGSNAIVVVADAEENNQEPVSFRLYQNYPNPFNPTTVIKYQVPHSGLVSLKVFDVLGREVATLVDEEKEAGDYLVDFNAGMLPSGVYFYRLTTANSSATNKMLLVR